MSCDVLTNNIAESLSIENNIEYNTKQYNSIKYEYVWSCEQPPADCD